MQVGEPADRDRTMRRRRRRVPPLPGVLEEDPGLIVIGLDKAEYLQRRHPQRR
jgi:hypothetical protein